MGYDEYNDDINDGQQVDVAANGEIQITIKRLPISEADIVRGVCRHFADRLTPLINERLDEITESAFTEAVNREAEKMLTALLTAPQRKTNSWGEPTGDVITMREYLADRFEKYMQQTVDREGRTSNDSYNRTRRSQWLIDTLGEKVVLEAAKVEVEKVRKAAESQISAAVANFIANKLAGPATAPLLPEGL